MATDDERREVAERLRAYVKRFRDPTWRELCNVVFLDEDQYPREARKLHLIDRLADLIEPSWKVCEIEGTGEGEPLPPIVDRDALLRLEKHIDRIAAETEAHFASVVSVRELREIAQDIREAIGETP